MFKKEFFPLFLAIDLQKRAKPSPGLLHTHCNENLSGAETKHFGARPGGSSMQHHSQRTKIKAEFLHALHTLYLFDFLWAD